MDHRSVADLLRSQGHRLTPQRLVVLEVIQNSGCHLTAEQIHAAVVVRHPFVNLATVYRTLQWLQDVNLVAPIMLSGQPIRYEYVQGDEHHHLVCLACGYQMEIDDSLLDTLKAQLLDRYGFAAQLSHLALPGRCAHCREATSTDAQTQAPFSGEQDA
jgi:Fur family ferric uptake transcriptional regulator